jgi:AcrR family transcriptional regulator
MFKSRKPTPRRHRPATPETGAGSGPDQDTGAPTKGDRTRALILETALGLFRERGFEGTTMRAVAERAEVSLGNAYYYFPSKEHLVQAFYGRTHTEHLDACAPVLGEERRLDRRLLGVMRAKLATIEPYQRIAGDLFRSAADPESPLNPFGPESAQVRAEAVGLFERTLEGSDARLPKDLRDELPTILWFWQMGVLLFWIHDRSPRRRQTELLLERTTVLVVRLISIMSLAVMRPVRGSLLRLVRELREEPAS